MRNYHYFDTLSLQISKAPARPGGPAFRCSPLFAAPGQAFRCSVSLQRFLSSSSRRVDKFDSSRRVDRFLLILPRELLKIILTMDELMKFDCVETSFILLLREDLRKKHQISSNQSSCSITARE